MSRETAQTWIFGAWVAAIGLTTFRQIAGKSSTNLAGWMPTPSVYLGSAVLFTLLWGGSLIAPGLAATIAVGTDVGILIAPYIAKAEGKSGGTDLLSLASTWLAKVSPPPSSTPSTGSTS